MFLALLARPPDPPLVGDRWREMWQQRLDGLNVMVEDWLRHQRRDDVLAAWLGERGLLGHRVRRVRGRRLARRLLERDPAAAGGVVVTAPRPHRPVGARLPATRRARPELRLPARGRPLLRPLAQGHRHRDHARADAARVHAGGRARGAVLRGLPRALGRRDRPGPRRGSWSDAGASATARSRRRALPGSTRSGADVDVAAADRHDRRRVVPLRHGRSRPGVPGRPADRRRAVDDLRFARRCPSAWRSSARPWSSSTSRSTSP